jgi:hypothetical protein
MQQLRSAITQGQRSGACQNERDADTNADLDRLVDLFRQSGSPEAIARAERMYSTYKMLAANINPAYASQLSQRLSRSTGPTSKDHVQALKPLRRSDIVQSRRLKRKESASLAQLEKIDRQIAWVIKHLPEISSQCEEADRKQIASALRTRWNAIAPEDEKWSAKAAARRLAKAMPQQT